MKRYTASQLNTRMRLYTPARADLPSGGTTTTFVFVDAVWVFIEYLSNNPFWYAQSLMPIANVRLTMHYRPDLIAGMQIIDSSTPVQHIYRILQPQTDIENRHIYSQVIGQELEAGQGEQHG